VAYREATRLDPADAIYHDHLGLALSGQGRYAEAEAAFREAARLDPGEAIYHDHLGGALSSQDKHAEAGAAFREATRQDPGKARRGGGSAEPGDPAEPAQRPLP
jgi:Flp pilus assembly protein TadD